jgi:hypothetical protein
LKSGYGEIWDVYVAFHINTQESWARFEVEHPHFRRSLVDDGRTSIRSLGSSAGDSIIKNMQLYEGLTDSLAEYLFEGVEESEG